MLKNKQQVVLLKTTTTTTTLAIITASKYSSVYPLKYTIQKWPEIRFAPNPRAFNAKRMTESVEEVSSSYSS